MVEVGADICNAERLESRLKDERFLNKIFSTAEQKYISSKKNGVQTMAGLFAAKEAFLKALGVGIFNGINFTEIEISHEKSGKPFLNLSEETKKRYKIKTAKISISHDGGLAFAVCIIEINGR